MTAAGGHGVGQHVCAVGLVAAVGERAGAALGVGLYQETAQAGQVRPDFLGLIGPPPGHGGVAGVGGVHAAQFHRGGKVDAQIQLDAVGSENFQILPQSAEVAVGDEPAGSIFDVDVVDRDAVDAHGRQHAGIGRQARHIDEDFGIPEEEGVAGVAALDAAVHVVPVVQHAQAVGRGLLLVGGELRPRLARGLQIAQQRKNAVQNAHFAAARNGAAAVGGLQAVAIWVQGRVQRQGDVVALGQRCAVQALEALGQLRLGAVDGFARQLGMQRDRVAPATLDLRVCQPALGKCHGKTSCVCCGLKMKL